MCSSFLSCAQEKAQTHTHKKFYAFENFYWRKPAFKTYIFIHVRICLTFIFRLFSNVHFHWKILYDTFSQTFFFQNYRACCARMSHLFEKFPISHLSFRWFFRELEFWMSRFLIIKQLFFGCHFNLLVIEHTSSFLLNAV